MSLRFPSSVKLSIVVYAAVMALAVWAFDAGRFTTSMIDIFPKNHYSDRLKDASQLTSLNRLLVLSHGFDSESMRRLDAVGRALRELDAVETVTVATTRLGNNASEYLKSTYYQRGSIAEEIPTPEGVAKQLEALYAQMRSSFLFTPVNAVDPLGLIEVQMPSGSGRTKNDRLYIDGEGYLLVATLNIPVADVGACREFEKRLQKIIAPYGDEVAAFAPHLFSAQNSEKIKYEVNLIVTATVVLLLFFYVLSLRDPLVLLLSSVVLGSSLFTGLAVSMLFFEHLSVFTLAFGAGVSMMAVDYLFHYYFHGYYGPKSHYRKGAVTAAFVTTFAGFAVLTQVDFPLIAQLSLFSMVSLAFSYFQFTWLMQAFTLSPKAKRPRLIKPASGYVPPSLVALLSLGMIAVAVSRGLLDYDLRHLDYQNAALQTLQERFASAADSEQALLLYAPSLEAVLQRAERMQEDFHTFRSIADVARSQRDYAAYRERLAKVDTAALHAALVRDGEAAGFRPGFFDNAYAFATALPEQYDYDLEAIGELGYETRKLTDRWVSVAYISRDEAAMASLVEGVTVLDNPTLLRGTMEEGMDDLLRYGLGALLLIALLLLALLRRRGLVALNYILFPLGAILLLLSFATPLSIMHLFSLVIIMVAGVDYGIYMSRPQPETDESILYAMLTTFAGFGIFVFSNIGALEHIGTVICTGIVAVFILLRFQKRKEAADA